MTGTRFLVTGVADRLGHLLAQRLAGRAEVEAVVGVAVGSGTAVDAVAGVDVVTLSREYEGITDLIRRRGIDTIVHADRPWVRSDGGRSGHVIATMNLAAAAAHRTTSVRSVVMASSTLVYPVSSRAARLHPESESLQPRRGSLAASLLEAEGYVRNLATTNPNLSAAITRLADLGGRGANDPLAVLLAGPIVPTVWGFDPSVQLLHIDDAVAALEHAADHDLAGVYNIGAEELVRWRQAVRLTRKPHIELPAAPASSLSRLLQWMYRIPAGDDVVDVMKFGRAAATDAVGRSGFRPTSTTSECVTGGMANRPG